MIGKRVSMLVAMSLAFVGVSALDASAAVARANLAVVSASVDITRNCHGPAPALIAAVRIKNSGQALAANGGKVFLKQSGGAGLEGAVNLPAIGAGQEQTVNVPATSLQPFSRLVGSHQLQVTLRPNKNMFVEPAPYNLTAVFPGGHCGGVALVPRADRRGVSPSAVGRPFVDPRGLDTSARPPIRTCPDLAATRIDVVIESRPFPEYVDVKIEAVVKNIGLGVFEARNPATSAWIHVDVSNPGDLIMPIRNLAPGEEMTLVTRMQWYTRTSSRTQTATLVIQNAESSDNPRGVECRRDNNSLSRVVTFQ